MGAYAFNYELTRYALNALREKADKLPPDTMQHVEMKFSYFKNGVVMVADLKHPQVWAYPDSCGDTTMLHVVYGSPDDQRWLNILASGRIESAYAL